MSEKVYGLHAVRALLTRHAERVTQVTMVEGRADPRMTEIQTLAQKSGKTIKRAAPAVFKQLFGEAVHQGVFVEVLPLAMWREEELIAAIAAQLENEPGNPPFVLVLDGVQDPHNLGACLRTAAWRREIAGSWTAIRCSRSGQSQRSLPEFCSGTW